MSNVHPVIAQIVEAFAPPPPPPWQGNIAYIATKEDDMDDIAFKLANLALDRSTPADSRDPNSDVDVYEGSIWMDVTDAKSTPRSSDVGEEGSFHRTEYQDVRIAFNLIQDVRTVDREICRYVVWRAE